MTRERTRRPAGLRVAAPDGAVRLQEVYARIGPGSAPRTGKVIGSPEDVVGAVRQLIGERASEVFVTLFIDIRNGLVGSLSYTEGSPISVGVSPVGIFREALLVNGAGFITAHQHPTGDPNPSPEDIALWARLREAGRLMGIPCVDNLVLGKTRWYSENQGYSSSYPGGES